MAKTIYEGRVFYEIYVRSFADENGDGIGDLKGIIQKLDYIEELGIGGIWLMPIFLSPSDHGYDTTDYYQIHPDYGTMADLQELIKEAHKRDILVILDLVLNHTSTNHVWFKKALGERDGKYRQYYCWAGKDDDLNEPPLIFSKPWNMVSGTKDYYYSVFCKEMPDLNFDNENVRLEVKNIAKFYLKMGVDGFRLDAARWLYGLDDNCAAAFWDEFKHFLKKINPHAILVGEVCASHVMNEGILIAVDHENHVKYLKSLGSCFNFAVSEQILDGLVSGCAGKISHAIKEIYTIYERGAYGYIDSPFLTNHDMDRVMDRLGSIANAKKAAAILLTLPGTPYIYYGEETGMRGKKPDWQIRQPFVWDAVELRLNGSKYPIINDYSQIAVRVQKQDPNSMLNFYKKLISVRKHSEVLKYGTFEPILPVNACVMAYKRVLGSDEVYVYINAAQEEKIEDFDLGNASIVYSNKREGSERNLGDKKLLADEILIFSRN